MSSSGSVRSAASLARCATRSATVRGPRCSGTAGESGAAGVSAGLRCHGRRRFARGLAAASSGRGCGTMRRGWAFGAAGSGVARWSATGSSGGVGLLGRGLRLRARRPPAPRRRRPRRDRRDRRVRPGRPPVGRLVRLVRSPVRGLVLVRSRRLLGHRRTQDGREHERHTDPQQHGRHDELDGQSHGVERPGGEPATGEHGQHAGGERRQDRGGDGGGELMVARRPADGAPGQNPDGHREHEHRQRPHRRRVDRDGGEQRERSRAPRRARRTATPPPSRRRHRARAPSSARPARRWGGRRSRAA